MEIMYGSLSRTKNYRNLPNSYYSVVDSDWIRIQLGQRIRIWDPDPHPGRQKLLPEKETNEEISWLKSLNALCSGGIVQPFELGGETRLIRPAVKK
jgi:hypothetical protein